VLQSLNISTNLQDIECDPRVYSFIDIDGIISQLVMTSGSPIMDTATFLTKQR
jgi:hypothetical protein